MPEDPRQFASSRAPEGQPESVSEVQRAIGVFEERHYSVAEIAAMWNLSVDAVRKLFRHERGVLAIGDRNPKRGKRPYLTLRIPQSVLERVYRQKVLG